MLQLSEIEIDRGDILTDEELIYQCVTSTIYNQKIFDFMILKKIKEIIIRDDIQYLEFFKFFRNISNRIYYRGSYIFKNRYEENDYIIKVIECLDTFNVFVYEYNTIKKKYSSLLKCLKLIDSIEILIEDYR